MTEVKIDWKDNAIGFMRLVMASMVLLGHAPRLGHYQENSIPGLFGDFGYGTTAVLGFMFLSGMLITRSMENSKGIVDFSIRRILRIYPGYWFCLLLVGFLFGPVCWVLQHHPIETYAFTGDQSALSYWLKNFTLKQDQDFIRNLYFGLDGKPEGVNYPVWTILSEFMCYIGTAVVGALGFGKKYRWIYAGLAALILAYLAFKFKGQPELFFYNRLLHVAAYLVGVVTYYFIEHVKLNWLFAALVGAAALVTCRFEVLYPLFPIFFGLTLLFFAFWTPIQHIERKADLSYGIYIYGWPTQLLVFHLGGASRTVWEYLFWTVLALIPFAAMSWFLIEKPAMQKRKWLAERLMKKSA